MGSLLLWSVGGIVVLISLKLDKKRTIGAFKMSKGMMGNMLPKIASILLLIGLFQGLLPPSTIQNFMGEANALVATLVGAVVGSITLIPGFVAFPLVGSFIDVGASAIPAVAFLTTLTMVGVATLPLEREAFGMKFTVYRNIFSFIFALIIALVMGVLI